MTLKKDSKIIAICFLAISAVALSIADFATPTARADTAVNSRDYQIVTGRIVTGGEGLYILDNRTGQIAVFTYDPSTRTLKPRVVRHVEEAFK
jgi:hypothetical protein